MSRSPPKRPISPFPRCPLCRAVRRTRRGRRRGDSQCPHLGNPLSGISMPDLSLPSLGNPFSGISAPDLSMPSLGNPLSGLSMPSFGNPFSGCLHRSYPRWAIPLEGCRCLTCHRGRCLGSTSPAVATSPPENLLGDHRSVCRASGFPNCPRLACRTSPFPSGTWKCPTSSRISGMGDSESEPAEPHHRTKDDGLDEWVISF
jgi:hypothetical protein